MKGESLAINLVNLFKKTHYNILYTSKLKLSLDFKSLNFWFLVLLSLLKHDQNFVMYLSSTITLSVTIMVECKLTTF
jgi:hypothetical protein